MEKCSLERVLIREVLLNGEKMLIRVLIREEVFIRVLIIKREGAAQWRRCSLECSLERRCSLESTH